jgi:uncharacterized phage protein gp47/JayE
MNYTAEELQKEMLDSLTGYDKTKGTWLWDIFMGAAILGEKLWEELEDIRAGYDPDKLTGNELDVYVKSWRNLERKTASYAEGDLTVTGTGYIPEGIRCLRSEAGVYYQTTESVSIEGSGTVHIRCLSAGSAGNCDIGEINTIILSSGSITGCANETAFSSGYDEETDEELRQRYYDSMEPYGSGNKKHYEMWAREVQGVGLAKVQRAPQGAGTVSVTIIAGNGVNATDELVEKVQEYLDPIANRGEGVGMAPVGAVVTVYKATESEVDIDAELELKGEFELSEVVESIKSKINDYIGGLSFKNNELSYGMIYNLIFAVDGVVDCENLTINGGKENIYCKDTEIFAPTYSFTEK